MEEIIIIKEALVFELSTMFSSTFIKDWLLEELNSDIKNEGRKNFFEDETIKEKNYSVFIRTNVEDVKQVRLKNNEYTIIFKEDKEMYIFSNLLSFKEIDKISNLVKRIFEIVNERSKNYNIKGNRFFFKKATIASNACLEKINIFDKIKTAMPIDGSSQTKATFIKEGFETDFLIDTKIELELSFTKDNHAFGSDIEMEISGLMPERDYSVDEQICLSNDVVKELLEKRHNIYKEIEEKL